MHIKKIGLDKFIKHKEDILDIYFEAGTTGVMEQHLDRETETRYMKDIFKFNGYGYIVFEGSKLIGFLLACPLSHDSLLPNSIKRRFSVGKCFYISEMHLDKEYRGRGIGSVLLKKFIDEISDNWDYLFIRAWKKNVRAINFYQKHGFRPGEVIEQEKIKKDQSGTFVIQKQYLWQKLN